MLSSWTSPKICCMVKSLCSLHELSIKLDLHIDGREQYYCMCLYIVSALTIVLLSPIDTHHTINSPVIASIFSPPPPPQCFLPWLGQKPH